MLDAWPIFVFPEDDLIHARRRRGVVRERDRRFARRDRLVELARGRDWGLAVTGGRFVVVDAPLQMPVTLVGVSNAEPDRERLVEPVCADGECRYGERAEGVRAGDGITKRFLLGVGREHHRATAETAGRCKQDRSSRAPGHRSEVG